VKVDGRDHVAGSEPRRARASALYVPASERADRTWNRALAIGLIAAVMIHLAILLSSRTRWTPSPPFAAAGPQASDTRAAAGGGGGMEVVRVRVQEERVVAEEPTPTPVPVPDVPEMEVEIPPQPEPTTIEVPELAGALPGQGELGQGPAVGDLAAPGSASGTGLGSGGADAEGASGMLAPVPRGMILPPADRPRNVRGREVTVWVFVTETGRVLPDSTRLEPPTPDAGYNRRLRQSASEWSFEPARSTGRPVAAWYPYEIEL
jgi:hypothetical protein